MADEEQLKRLRQDVREWNKWRADQIAKISGTFLVHNDLRGATMSGADLRGLSDADRWALREMLRAAKGVDLSGANLSGGFLFSADLSGADLSGADLSGANLCGAYLSRARVSSANLSGVNLSDATLIRADLTNADLSKTFLNSADLSHAKLKGVNLIDARLGETVFGNVDLAGVTGLEQCRHEGPSTIDHRTLEKSGPLPLAFLRGVGLPDNLIEYLPSLFNQAIQHYSCFISYSTKDQEFADRLYADLQNKGVRCWFAPHDLPIGAKTWDAIDDAIKLRDKLLLILSESSIKSDWVEDEVQKAFAEERDRKELILFPVRVDDAVMETPEPWARKLRDQRNVGDFRKWKDHDAYKRSFERVLRDLTIPPAK
jgi:hypothetical protein